MQKKLLLFLSLSALLYTAQAGVITVTTSLITQDPVDQTVLVGGNATFSVAASSPNRIRYQWLKDGSPILRATNSVLALKKVTYANGGTYTVNVWDNTTTNTSAPALLSIYSLPANTYTGVNAEDDSFNTAADMQLLLRTNGVFSGVLYTDGDAIALAGTLNGYTSTNVISRARFGKPDLYMQTTVYDGGAVYCNFVTNYVADDGFGNLITNSAQYASVYLAIGADSATISSYVGKYTMYLFGLKTPGYMLAEVKTNGQFVFSGSLPDATTFSGIGKICSNAVVPVLIALTRTNVTAYDSVHNKSVVNSEYQSFVMGNFDLGSGFNLTWVDPVRGFTNTLGGEIYPYTPPATGTPVLADSFPYWSAYITGSDTNDFIIEDLGETQLNNTFVFANGLTNGVRAAIVPSTGLVNGSFKNPTTGKVVTFKGALVQGFGSGPFFGPGTTSTIYGVFKQTNSFVGSVEFDLFTPFFIGPPGI